MVAVFHIETVVIVKCDQKSSGHTFQQTSLWLFEVWSIWAPFFPEFVQSFTDSNLGSDGI